MSQPTNSASPVFNEVWEPIAGYVYILRPESARCTRGWKSSGQTGAAPTKVGMCRYHPSHEDAGPNVVAHVVYKRKRDIEQNHWQELYVHTHSSFLGNAAATERRLKERYKKFHLRGEWFNLTPKQMINIERWLFRQSMGYWDH